MDLQAQLAIDGGDPVRIVPPPHWPSYDSDELAAVSSVLRSGKVNQWTGHCVRDFELQFARHVGMPFGVAVANGSLALEIALRALGVGSGDEVIVPCRSFIASASSVNNVGATPVFADVDYDTQLLTAGAIEPHIGAATKAILPVHLNGRPCEMTAIMALAARHNLLIIEDCAQSLGASISGRLAGAFGHASVFSFCQDKIITTGGEGGMALFRDKACWSRAWSFKDHGKSFDAASALTNEIGYRWLHESIGSNYRMLEIQAALGLAQLPKLPNWLARRNRNAHRLIRALAKFPCVVVTQVPESHQHAYYRLEVTISPDRLRPEWSRDRILAALLSEGIHAGVGACPAIYREGAYAKGATYAPRPNAERLAQTSLAFLTHPTIDDRYLSDCEAAFDKVFAAASR